MDDGLVLSSSGGRPRRRIQVEVLVLAHIRVKGTLRREQRRNCFPQGGLEKGFGTLEDAPPAGNGLAPGSKGIRCRLSCSAASSVNGAATWRLGYLRKDDWRQELSPTYKL